MLVIKNFANVLVLCNTSHAQVKNVTCLINTTPTLHVLAYIAESRH